MEAAFMTVFFFCKSYTLGLVCQSIAAVKGNLKAQLNNISIKEADGSVTNLGEKYGNKKTH